MIRLVGINNQLEPSNKYRPHTVMLEFDVSSNNMILKKLKALSNA